MQPHLNSSQLYRRTLPGGGQVTIEFTAKRTLFRDTAVHGAVMVDRRADPQRSHGAPPVVARATGKSVKAVFDQLLPVAESNVAICTSLMRQGLVAL